MISSCSFLKLLSENGKKRVWLYLLSAYLYLTYIMDYTLAQSGNTLFIGDTRLGPGNRTVFLITVLLAILCAFQGFGFLFSEEKTDFYLSLPVKRSRVFLTAYINGLLIVAIPCVISRLACYLLEGSRSADALYVAWMGILTNLLGFLAVYNLVLCIILLTGHSLIAFAGTALLFFYGTLAFGLVIGKYSGAFFDTYYKIDFVNLLSVYASPYRLLSLLCGTADAEDIGAWMLKPHLQEFIFTAVIATAAFILAYMLFLKRPAEAAGRALAFDKAKILVKFILSVPIVLIIGYYIMLCSPSGHSFPLLAVGILFGAFTVNGLLEIIFQFDIRGMLAAKKQFLCITLLCLFCAGSFSLDIWGYDKYIPASEDVDSASVIINGLDDASFSSDAPLGFADADTQLAAMKLKGKDKDSLLSWLSDIRNHPNAPDDPVTYTAVSLRMADGRTVHRKYPIYSVENLEDFQAVYGSAAYKKGAFPVIDHKGPGVRQFVWSNGLEQFHLDLNEEESKALFALFSSELIALQISDLQKELPIGSLSLVYGSSDYGETAPLYSSFEKTLDYLEKAGIPSRSGIRDYKITEVQVLENRQEKGSFGRISTSQELVLDTRDEVKIQSLIGQMIAEGYAMNQILYPVNTKYKAVVSRRDSAGKTLSYSDMIIHVPG